MSKSKSSEYKIPKVNSLETQDFLREVTERFDIEDILANYDVNEIGQYAEYYDYKFGDASKVEEEIAPIEEISDMDLILEVAKRHKDNGILMREDVREIINEILDEQPNRCY
jgi:hypothetical protein